MKRILTLLVLTSQAVHVIAQACNALDPNFGSGGVQVGITTSDWLDPRNIVVQPDNKIVQFGSLYSNGAHFSIVRYNSDGSLDNSFGQNGRVLSSMSQYDVASFGAVQNDGKILVVGTVQYGGVALARYNHDGTPDNNFGSAGAVIIAGHDGDFARGLAIQSDGKIVVVGSTTRTDDCMTGNWGNQFCPNHFTVFRLKIDGSIDSSFGENGKVITAVGPNHAGYASSVAIQTDGKIVVAGSYLYNLLYDDYYGTYYFASSHLVMVRYNNDGVLDSSFGANGFVADASEFQSATAISLQADGKVLVTGWGGRPFEIERYSSDGSPDNSFGTGGKQFNNFQSWTSSILVLPDGKISVAGGTQHNFLITRLNNDGSFDTSFNGNGKLSLHLGPVGSYDNASAIALQGNQMIVGGSSNYSTSNTHSLTQLVVRLPDTVKGLSVVITPRGTLTPCDGGSTKLAVNETGTVQWYNQGTPITGATDTVYIAYTSGSYSVTVQNDRGCGESDYLDVVFDGLPVTITPSGSLIFCQGDSVILTANESGNLQWYKDNIIVPGATNTAYTAKTPGSYFLYVQNANGCGESSPLDVVVDPDRPPISWDGTKLITTSSNYSYQWYFNGHSITGATGFSFKPAELGTYKVVIADYKCNNASEDFNLDCNVVAVPQPSITWTGTTLVTATGFDNYEWYVNGDSIPGAHTALLAPAQLGAYRVRVTGNFGCQNTSEAFDVNCTLAGPPKPPNIWDGTKFSTTSGYAHYQWYQDDTAILDATANTYTPAATQFGFFKVVVTDNNNCTNTSEKQPHFVTSVSDISVGGARLRFYPNPAQSVVNVEIANNPRTKLEAQLYDLTGRLLQRKLLNQIQNQLRVDELPTGLYQLVIYNGTEKFAAKIAVIK